MEFSLDEKELKMLRKVIYRNQFCPDWMSVQNHTNKIEITVSIGEYLLLKRIGDNK